MTKKKLKNFSGAAAIIKRLGEQEKVDKKSLKIEKTWQQSLRRNDSSGSPAKAIVYNSKAKQAEAIARELLDSQIEEISNYRANDDDAKKAKKSVNTTRQSSNTRGGFNTGGIRS